MNKKTIIAILVAIAVVIVTVIVASFNIKSVEIKHESAVDSTVAIIDSTKTDTTKVIVPADSTK